VEKYYTARQATDDNMEHAHCKLDNKGYTYTYTQTPSENLMLIAFPLQQRLHKHASMLGYTYIGCVLNVLLYLYVTVRLLLHTL